MTTTVFMAASASGSRTAICSASAAKAACSAWATAPSKVFFTMTPERKKKLAAFPASMPARVIRPLDLCTDAKGELVGYAMRVLDGAVDAHRLAQRKWRESNVRAPEVLEMFRTIASTIAELHELGVVVGDLNDGNVVLTPPQPSAPWQPWFIDADSMQWRGHPCTVAHERFPRPAALRRRSRAHRGAVA